MNKYFTFVVVVMLFALFLFGNSVYSQQEVPGFKFLQKPELIFSGGAIMQSSGANVVLSKGNLLLLHNLTVSGTITGTFSGEGTLADSLKGFDKSLYALLTAVLKNSDSTSIRNYSNNLYLKNSDSTSIRNYSNQLYLLSTPTSAMTTITPPYGVPDSVLRGIDITPGGNGHTIYTQIYVPHNVTFTGLTFLIGSVGGTDSVMVYLFNSAGTQVAASARGNGTSPGVICAATATYQSVAFGSTYAAIPGIYYAGIQCKGTTMRLRGLGSAGFHWYTGDAATTYGAAATISPSQFTQADQPYVITY